MKMTSKKKTEKNVYASRKFKYGTVAIVFTLIFCAFIILLNAVFSGISNYNGGFYLDLTSEQIYDISDITIEALSGLDQKVEIIFCKTEDRVDDDSALSYVKRLAEKYHNANSNITLVFKDLIKDPVYFNQFRKTETDTISESTVIINCPQNKRYVTYSAQNFFKFSSETGLIFAYDGENKLTSAIRQTALNQIQKAAFITGHGEEKRASVDTLLREQGYEVSDVDLKNITEEELAEYDLLIISNPKYDYTGVSASAEGRVNEIGMLNNYLTKSFGNLMVFIGPETPALEEFSNFLADDWGVSYNSGDIAVEGESMSLDISGLYFLGTPYNQDSYGKSIHSSITSSGVQATLFANATPLSIVFDQKAEKSVSPVYLTSQDSQVIRDGEVYSGANMPVMTLSVYSKLYDNTEYHSNVLVCGSVDYMNFVSEQSFANADILKSAMSAMGNESIVTGIAYKVVDDTSITVTQDNFKRYTVMLSTIVPVIIAVIGTIVYIKRKKA